MVNLTKNEVKKSYTMYVKDKKKEEIGVTLIALVVTIVVLLILASITISAITGEKGVIKEARTAKEQTEKAGVEGQVELAVIKAKEKHRNPTMDDVIEELKNNKVITNSSQVDKKTGAITSDLGYLIEGKLDDYIVIPGSPDSNGYFTKTSTIDGTSPSAYNPSIPSGFKPIDTDSSSWGDGTTAPTTDDVNKGLVITDGNSEFVWIPVPDPSLMYGTDADGKKWGKLYEFTAIGSEDTALNWTEEDGKIAITDSSNFREPDIVSGNDGNSTYLGIINGILGISYSNSSEFLADMKIDFNNMIESVEKYKGFYVGRYETSLNSNGVAQSKQGETSSNASEENNYRWYGLYAIQKKYSTESVQGSMIWGSQYDAMMKWMKGNGIDVTSNTPTDLSTGTTSKNTTRITGGANEGETVSKDKISNIYDLLGNSYEWILEADGTNSRACRGGRYSNSYSPSFRNYSFANSHGDYYGSRASLYIKP